MCLKDISALEIPVLKRINLKDFLQSVYTDFHWEQHKFVEPHWDSLVKGVLFVCVGVYKVDLEGKKKLVKRLEEELKIEKVEEWNNILESHLEKVKLPPKWK